MANQSKARRHDARVELNLTDLRAHFEAQLRAVARAEESYERCRRAKDPALFDDAATACRDQLTIISKNRQAIGELLSEIVNDVAALTLAARRSKT